MVPQDDGHRGHDGEGSETGTFDPSDRGQFVADLLSDFGRRRTRVDPAVVEFVLQKVLVSDEEWSAGWRARRFDPSRVATKLERSLESAAERATALGQTEIDLLLAEAVYAEARGDSECVFPFRQLC